MKRVCMHKVFNHGDDNIVRGMDIHQHDTRNKECLKKTKSVTDKALLRSINSFVTDWNILPNYIRKLRTLVHFERAIFSRFY